MIEDTFAFRLLKAVKSTRSVIWPVLTAHGLHPGQELLLSQLWLEDGLSQTELGERLGIEPPTVSKALHRLERVGYVRREPGPGRVRRVHLTEAGLALREPVEEAWRNADAQLLRNFDAEDHVSLAGLLKKMTKAS